MATRRSTSCTTRHITARSNQPSLNGNASALACLNATPRGAFRLASRSIAGDASTAHTLPAPRSASAALRRAVPQPMSSTVLARRSPSRSTSAYSSHQLSSIGRSSSYRDAILSKSGAGAELIGLRHRLDRVLREVDRRLRNEHGERVRLHFPLELGLDASLGQDRLNLLRFVRVARDRDSDHLAHVVSSTVAGSGAADSTRRPATAPLSSLGTPRSANGTSTTSKSRGTTVSGKIARASRATSAAK